MKYLFKILCFDFQFSEVYFFLQYMLVVIVLYIEILYYDYYIRCWYCCNEFVQIVVKFFFFISICYVQGIVIDVGGIAFIFRV